jgi:hypothetical protein
MKPNIFTHVLYAWLPALRPVPARRPRLPRPPRRHGYCPDCDKSLAIIASTGAVWRHRCEPVHPLEREQSVPSDLGMEGRR